MGFRSLLGKARKAAGWVAAKLNYIPDHKYERNGINTLDDSELIAAKRGTRTSLASSITGEVVNAALAVVFPILVVPAVINSVAGGRVGGQLPSRAA